MQHVTLLALNNMLSSSVAMPLEMLEASRARLQVAHDPRRHFRVDVAAECIAPLTMLGGFQIRPSCTLADIEQTDLIIIPALWRNPKRQIAQASSAIHWLQSCYQRGASVVAIGTGVCLLAEAGLLNGKPATTHWHYLDQFAQDYPKVQLQRQHLLTQAGRLSCAASINSGADLMVHVIGLHFGRSIALAVEQQFSPEVRHPFEKRVFYAEQRQQHPDERVAMIQTWVQQHSAKSLCLRDMAHWVGLSERQLHRRFKQVTGQTLGQYVQQIRCTNARELLQHSNITVADVGEAVGYSDVGYFIRVFKRWAGQTPGEFRQKVRAKLFSSEYHPS